MKHIVVAGAGKIGVTIADMLAASGDYRVTLADRPVGRFDGSNPSIETKAVDVTNPRELSEVLKGSFAVLSAVPFNLTGDIAVAAKESGAHYLDLTEDVATTRKVKRLAEGAKTAFIPQCGLAPGFITIALTI